MSGEHEIDITVLRLGDARRLAPLLSAYTQALKRGAPRRPDEFYAEMLLQDRTVEVLGASIDGDLAGFAIFADLPDPLTGLRSGQVDHLYVHHKYRSGGIARALIDLLCDQAEERGWSKLNLNAPRQPDEGRKFYEQVAAPSDWTGHVIRFEER